MSQFSAAAAAPGIRPSQLSHSGIGDVADSLNLFRGDVNIPLPIVSLSGRNGLDVALTALYTSNVGPVVQASNRIAPAGVLGVGWALPRDQVVLENRLSGADDEAIYLVTGGSPLRAVRSDEGDVFELVDYQFWTITHHRDELNPEQDRWEVVRDDGSIYVYGGTGIEWGVRWDNWSGASTAPGGQRFPVAWNLIRVTSPQGDTISFEYEREEVPVGTGPSYTRACYLTAITDTFGQRITLCYRDKEPFEVAPPHPVPDGVPAAFQDSYESRYLDQITVAADDGAALSTISLGYRFLDVADASEHIDDGYRKRYLTSVTQAGCAGIPLPPVTIDYHDGREDANPGAIRTLTYPKGAVVSYDYTADPLSNAATSRSVPSPGPGYVPRVWHGPGYVVVTWHSAMTGDVNVQAYSWNGTWNAWSDTKAWAVAEDTLYVQTAQGFYAAGYTDSRTGEHRVRLYRQDPYRNGEWYLSPYQLNLPASQTAPLVRLGRDFAAVADPDGDQLLIVSWDPVSGGWTEQWFGNPGADKLSLAVTADECVVGSYDAVAQVLRLALYHRDDHDRWVRSDVLDEPVEIDWQLTAPASILGAGDTFAAISFVAGLDEQQETVRYGLRLVTWDADHTFGRVIREDLSQPVVLANPIGAVGISGATVGNAQHLFRYDGREWHRTDLLGPVVGNGYGYAYGSDVAVAAIRTADGAVSYRRRGFDAYTREWLPGQSLPGHGPASGADPEAAHVSVSGDVLIAGHDVLRRSPTLDWEPLLTLPSNANMASVANRAPTYLAWQDVAEPGGAAVTRLVTFDADGHPRPGYLLDGESCYVAEPKQGQVLAGFETCVTYRGKSMDAANALRLHRIVGAEVDAELVDRAVCRATVDDGYQVTPVTVEYDRTTGTYDPYALVAQYVRVRLYRGEPTDAPGYVESIFFNGLRPDVPGVEYPFDNEFSNARAFFAKLNGQLYTQTAVDAHGRPVRRLRNDLYTYDRVNSDYRCRGTITRLRRTETAESLHLFDADPGFAAALDARTVPAELIKLHNDKGFPLIEPITVTVVRSGGCWTIEDDEATEFTAVLADGRLGIFGWIAEVSESEYNEKGQLSRTRARNVNSEGETTERLTLTTFAWEVYPALATRHMYHLAAEVRTVDTRTATVIDRSVSAYRENWPSVSGVWSRSKTYWWDGTPGVGDFDFAAWSEAGEPERGWLRTNQVLDVTSRGLARATRDIDGNVGGTIYDRSGRFPVAVCGLADPTAGQAGWCGFEEYEDAGGWQLTPDGTDPAEYITAGDAFTGRRRLAIPGDPAQRIGLRRTFSTAGDLQPSLLSCWIKTGPEFAADPELAGWQVTVGDADPIVSAIPDTEGRWRFFHQIVPGGTPGEPVTVEVFSRQDHRFLLVDAICFGPLHGRCTATVYAPGDKLPEAALDQTGTVTRYGHDRERRPVLTVRDGEPVDSGAEYFWRAARPGGSFDPADPNALLGLIARSSGSYTGFRHGDEWTRHWQASAGWETAHGQLRYDGASGPGTLDLRDSGERRDYAVRFMLASAPGAAGTLGLAFGTAFVAQWSDGRWQLRDRDGTVLAETAAPELYPDVTLCVTGASMLLAAGGQIVLHHTFVTELSGAVQLRTDGPLAIAWIAVCGSPVMRVCYTDNTGQTRQAQSIGDGQVLVSAWGYDRQGRAEIVGKPVRVVGSPGYRAAFIVGLDPATGRMRDCELTAAYPEDDGYPFSRTLFEPSPLGRVIEQGAPGKELAIDPSVSWADRHTVRTMYALNVADPVLGLPPGQYRSTAVLDPGGIPTTQLTDRTGAPIATRSGNGGTCIRSQMRYDRRGKLTEIRQPNWFDSTLPEHGKHVVRMDYDPVGNLAGVRTADMDGPARRVYDRAGRLRFQLTPQQAADGQLCYCRYDRMSRLIEQGTCESPWNEGELRAHAGEPGWLPGEPRWRLRYEFDGDGADLSLLGRLWRAQAADDQGAAVTTSTFRYDKAGLVESLALGTTGSPDRTVGYRHDLCGTTTALEYADEGIRVDYRFDEFNRTSGVAVTGPDGRRQEVAGYTYRPDGSFDTETLRPGDGELVRGYSYTNAGWLREIADRHLVESTEYFSDGRAARVGSRFTGVDDPAFRAEHHYEYGYDALGRLRWARGVPDGPDSIGDRVPLSYDPNGNLLTLQRGPSERPYVYYPGTNRLRRVGDDGDNHFNGDGDLADQPGRLARTFGYDPVSGRPVRVGTDRGATFGFRYNAAGERVLKSGPDGRLSYLRGVDGAVLAAEQAGQPRQHLIRGPAGLTAVYRAGDLQHLLTGRLGSTRALWDGSRLVAAYNYRPFGEMMTPAYQLPTAVAMPYLFTGAECDAETGLYNLGARFYDPVTGRMISVDPAGQYPSPYLYAGSDPVNLFDPTGEFSWSWEAFGAVLLGVVLLIGGIALTVVTAGAATPAGVALGTLAGGLFLGAGVASAAYGFGHADADTSKFDWTEWGVTVGLGAGFGMLAAAGSLALAPALPTLGSLGALGVETLFGASLGMADSITNTVVMNYMGHREPTAGWETALWTGALAGGVGGFIGGALGRAGNLRTSSTLARGAQEPRPLLIAETEGAFGSNARVGWYIGPSINVTRSAVLNVTRRDWLNGMDWASNPGWTSWFRDNFGHATGRLRATGLYPPPWAFNPRMLTWWAATAARNQLA